MRQIAVIFLAVCMTALPVYASGVTDSIKPLGHMKWGVTVEDNFIFDKDIELGSNDSKFDLENINQIYAKLSLGVTQYFNLYVKLGASEGGEISRKYSDTGDTVDVDTDFGFLWGVGTTAVTEIGGAYGERWKAGLDLQFNTWNSDADSVTRNGGSTTNVSGEIENYEVQITPFITREFAVEQMGWYVNPYLGVVINLFWTQTDGQIKYTQSGTTYDTSWSLKGDDNIGILLGTDIEITQNFALNVEGRFIEETAITAGATYRF